MYSNAHYQPLSRDGCNTFRLLTLEAGTSQDPIVCQLNIADISDYEGENSERIFDAVSHAWGPKVNVMSIPPVQLGAWQVNVRENLYRFLQAIRSPDESLTLWIDALCIDQENVEERSYQVQIMDRIYKDTRRCLVWLGVESNERLLAMDLIEDICGTPARATRMSRSESTALLAWAHCPYWTRTWVVQEFLLARDVLVICGHRSLEWSTLATFLRHLQVMPDEGPGDIWNSWPAFFSSPAYTLMRQRIVRNMIDMPLTELLIKNKHTQCEEPYDKVYAMLGLAARPKSGDMLLPDYSEDLRYVLLQTLECCHVPAENMARHARFLGELLSISVQKIMSPLGHGNRLANKQWKLAGFSIGDITQADRIDEQSLLTSLHNSYNGSQRMQRLFTNSSAANINRMLTDLFEMYSKYSTTFYKLLELYEEHRDSQIPRKSARTAHLVAVLTKNCAVPEILIGLALGNVSKDDIVTYFFGHPVGIVTKDARMVGVVTCAHVDESPSTRDLITKQLCRYWTLQNETSLRDEQRRVSFQFSNEQLLQLSQ